MDFRTILYEVQKNKVTKKEPIRYYSTKFEPPKKEQRNKNQMTVNVKKFLEKKQQEENQKRLEALKKKEELLALRSKDKKAVKRVTVMLKRTKSANQSVIADAVDFDNTALTLAGPAQPDEDDYGYVSQEASAFYYKMMEKYNKIPEERPKFPTEKRKVSTNLNNTKNRVKAALEREKGEALLHCQKRKRKPENLDDNSVLGSDKKHEELEEKQESKKRKVEKPKLKAPPPMNFADLLKLAEKKQFEPIVINKKTKERENPLTKEQKKELERIREWEERKKVTNKMPTPNKGKSADHRNRIGENVRDKINESSNTSVLADALTKTTTKVGSSSKTEKLSDEPEVIYKPKFDWGPKHPGAGRMNNSNNSSLNGGNSKLSHGSSKFEPSSTQRSSFDSKKPATADIRKSLYNNVAKSKPNDDLKSKALLSENSLKVSNAKNNKQKENSILSQKNLSDKMKPKEFPPRDMIRPKKFPPADIKRPIIRPNKLKVNKGRIIDDDDDDEEDSEMDDFIDDGLEGEVDYSKYISEIFGYNKSKYADFDDEDDDQMESSYAQQMKEENISTKIGLMEDLEDMKLEKEHKKRKALMRKKLSEKR